MAVAIVRRAGRRVTARLSPAPRSRPRRADRTSSRSRRAARRRWWPGGAHRRAGSRRRPLRRASWRRRLERVHEPPDLYQRRVLLELEARQHLLVGHAVPAVAERRTVVAEGDRGGRRVAALVEPDEHRLRVDEAADQPGAGEAVGEERFARRPAAAEVGAVRARDAGRRRRGRASGKISSRTRASMPDQHRSALSRSGELKKSSATDRLEVAALLAEHPVDRDRVGDPEPGLERFHRLHELPVLLGAVEQTAELLRLRLVHALYVQDVDAAVDARHEPASLAETAAVLGRFGQQVDAVAQRRAAQRLQRAEHLHPPRGVVGGKLGDEREPARGGRRVAWGRSAGASHQVPPSGAAG